MKNIGILTFHRAINYGALLQVYALQKIVKKLGFDAEIIDYGSIGAPDAAVPLIKRSMFSKLFDIKKIVSRFNRLVKRIEDIIFKNTMNQQVESFGAFEKEYLNISEDSYSNSSELKSAKLTYDGVITGSDQVWNPLITQNDLAYFLNFVSDDNKKISYAASFGIENIPEDFQEMIAPELKSIKCLSVREASGARVIKRIVGRDAQVVVDPTLLLSDDDWKGMIPEAEINEPYIFCYALLGNPELTLLCKHLSEITGYKIVRLSLYHRSFQRIRECFDRSTVYVNDSGPLEFLSYLKNSSIVVTNSFHGMIFSINFQKDFFVLPPDHSVERIVNSLDLYGLGARLHVNGSKQPSEKDIEIDYSKVVPIVISEKNKSIEFLKNSLNGL